jgi:hypothetical protein
LGLGFSSLAHAQAPSAAAAPGIFPAQTREDVILETAQQQLHDFNAQEPVKRVAAKDDDKDKRAAAKDDDKDKLQKQIDLQNKKIDTLEKMVRLLADELKKKPPAGAVVEKLETQAATLDARSVQAAQRDVELSHAIDDIREQKDAEERNGVALPATLKELFLPTQTNETPLSIYGALAFGYSKFLGDTASAANGAGRGSTPGAFYFGEFTPDFLLKLNDWIFLEAEIGITADGSVSAGSFAQADFFINDWLTIIAGRFVAPIGWFNERLNNPWINKLPGDAPGSAPPLWMQVLPPMSLLGVEAQGSFYLGCSPLKLEYAAYVSNGLNVTPATAAAPLPSLDELANLENMQNTFSAITNEKAVGGRIGLWWPEAGLEAGLSGLYSGDYLNGTTLGNPELGISLWAADFNYHKGNWDVRAEYGMTYQQAQVFIGNNIRRQGFYAQVAYRPRDSHARVLQDFEFVYRYSYINIRGIDETMLTLSSYASPVDVPVQRRQQNEFGLNYYFYPRMVLKVAYQINDEPGFHLHDNQFLTELAWGW